MSELDTLVGVSVSEPEDSELESRGLSKDHLGHAFVELARQILSPGGSLAYGGNLSRGGYTWTLIALLRTYSDSARPSENRIRLYLGRPVWDSIGTAELKDLRPYATVERVPGTDVRGDARVTAARDYTLMRERMTADTDARVALGGKLHGHSGRWPGIVEEAYLAVRAGLPLYVAGGFGGAAARLADGIRGDWPPELTTEYQRANNRQYDSLLEAGVGVSEEELRDVLCGHGLRNGLDADDNQLLLETVDLDLMVALVLRGLLSQSEGQGRA
jgi:hypothetical protein